MNKVDIYKIDKIDIEVSIASGALTGFMDVLWIGDISLKDAHKWGSEQIDNYVIKVAKKKGYNGNDISGAIHSLEEKYKLAGDSLTSEFGGALQHHLRDFSHHPTPVGLFFSILTQFTGRGYGTDSKGKFVKYDVPGWEKKGFREAVYLGTISWGFHLVSDMAGSSGTRRDGGRGTGIPGPILSMLKELSSVPGIRNILGKTDPKQSPNKEANYQFSTICSKLFNGTLLGEHDENGKIIKDQKLQFDFRTEWGMVHESIENKQYIPVLINELIVAAFYSIRRFMMQIPASGMEDMDSLKEIDVWKCLPWRNSAYWHMRMIASTTFSAIDIAAAGIRAAIKNKNNPAGFALDFLQGINYWGLGSFAIATNSEILMGVKKMFSGFAALAEKQKQAIIERLPNGKEDWNEAKSALLRASAIAKIGTPIGFAFATVELYGMVKKAINEKKLSDEENSRIVQECTERIQILEANRKEIEATVSDYLYGKLSVFDQAFSKIDSAITEGDVEEFILGNCMIQEELTGKTMFRSMKEFDEMMLSDDTIVF